MLKICTKCKEEKEIKNFGKHPTTKDKLYPRCKACRKQFTIRKSVRTKPKQTEEERKKQRMACTKVWQKTDKGKKVVAKSRKRYNQRLKQLVFENYGGVICACCEETEIKFLTIDHVNNDGAKHRKTFSNNFYNWLKNNNYPEGFQVLCFNCNCGKRLNNGVCPHTTNTV